MSKRVRHDWNGALTPSATGSVRITHEIGLHARPSVKLTKLAKTFASDIGLALADDGPWIDAKSIAKVMAAKVPQDSTLHFRASGHDAREAIEALIGLVERDFANGDGESPTG
jgi:phosphocarrier protein HPr